MVLRSAITLAGKRIPLIKFRKGGNFAHSGSTQQASLAQAGSDAHSSAIEDWELPQRFWRKPMDPAEMAYINNGGPI